MRSVLLPLIILVAGIFTLNAQPTDTSSRKVSKKQQKKDKADSLKMRKNASDSLVGKNVYIIKNTDGSTTVVTEEEAIRRGITPAKKK